MRMPICNCSRATKTELLVTGVTENKVIDRRRNGEPTIVEVNQRLLTQANERLTVRDHVLTQIIVTEEG